MNEPSCLLFSPLSLFYLTFLNTLDIFISRLLFLQTPFVYVFLGFILFLMESHLHKFMILTWLFIHSQGIPAVCPSSGPRAGTSTTIYCIRTTHYSPLTRKLDPVHILPPPCVITSISMHKKPRSNPLG